MNSTSDQNGNVGGHLSQSPDPVTVLSPDEAKRRRQTKIAMIATAGVLAAGLIYGVVTTLQNPTGLLPQKPAAAENQPLPGNTQPSSPLAPTGKQRLVTKADVKDFDALVESSKITYSELKDGNDILPKLVERINAMMNVRLTEDEISASNDLISASGKTGPAALAEMKLSAMGSSFKDKTTVFYKDFVTQGQKNFDPWLKTRHEDHPFEAKFVKKGTQYTEYAYVSNVNENSLNDKDTSQVFKFAALASEFNVPKGDTGSNRGYWLITGQAKLLKTDETIPNP